MTNPLQVELQVAAACNAFVQNLIMVGDGLPSPVMLVQLKSGLQMTKTEAEELWQAVTAAQKHQPAYSALSTSRIVVLGDDESLPTSAKVLISIPIVVDNGCYCVQGNVIRSKCERMFKAGVNEIEWAHMLDDTGTVEEGNFDSLDFMRQKSVMKTSECECQRS